MNGEWKAIVLSHRDAQRLTLSRSWLTRLACIQT